MAAIAIASATAPGKLVLTGDYAVLFNAPAIAMAVDRYARVDIFASEYGYWLDSPGLADGRREFERHESGEICWQTAHGGELALFQRFAEQLLSHYEAASGLGFRLDTDDFFVAGRKLGLGSSAALSVAMGRASALLGVDKHAGDVHQSFQSGRGSGIDIAVATEGGVIEFRRAQSRQSRQLHWPADLRFQAVDTGSSQSTPAMLARLEVWRERKPDVASRLLNDLSQAAEAAVLAWTDDVAALLLAVEGYSQRLQKLDEASGLGIFSGGHAEIAELAKSAGVVYKPSGAGGGDIGVALSNNVDALQKFSIACDLAGFSSLKLGRSNCGVEPELP